MYANKTVGAVVPAYNEEDFIGEVIETLPSFIDRAYVIDDGSTDGTWAEITAHVTDFEPDGGTAVQSGPETPDVVETDTPTVVPVRHRTNRGVGAAITTGYRHALADRMDVTAVIAGDGQTAPDVVERIVAPVAHGRVDYAKGNRMLTREGMPPVRQVGNVVLAVLTKIASGYWKLNDPQNGSTAISLSALETIDLDAVYTDYGFTNDMLVRLNVHGMRVADVGRRAVYRDETSHINFGHFVVTVSWLLLRGFLWRLRKKYLVRDFHPLALLYLTGAGTTMAGLVGKLRERRSADDPPRGHGGLTVLLGWLCLLSAMVLDAEENDHLQETRDPPADERS